MQLAAKCISNQILLNAPITVIQFKSPCAIVGNSLVRIWKWSDFHTEFVISFKWKISKMPFSPLLHVLCGKNKFRSWLVSDWKLMTFSRKAELAFRVRPRQIDDNFGKFPKLLLKCLPRMAKEQCGHQIWGVCFLLVLLEVEVLHFSAFGRYFCIWVCSQL